MQTRNLTWKQAKNLLVTGMTPCIEFDFDKFYNYYTFEDGKIQSNYLKERRGEISKQTERKCEGERFRAVETPTHA